jgi:ribulose 1,5-bisphosphate carboxylase large subunit-like protein
MAEMGNIPEVLPAFGGAMQASRHADLSHLIGPQYGFVAGGAVFGHPDGIEAGIINIIKQFSISQP